MLPREQGPGENHPQRCTLPDRRGEGRKHTTTSNDNRRTYNQQSTISFEGSNFYINDRQDAYALAVEIASLTRRQQRGKGLRMA